MAEGELHGESLLPQLARGKHGRRFQQVCPPHAHAGRTHRTRAPRAPADRNTRTRNIRTHATRTRTVRTRTTSTDRYTLRGQAAADRLERPIFIEIGYGRAVLRGEWKLVVVNDATDRCRAAEDGTCRNLHDEEIDRWQCNFTANGHMGNREKGKCNMTYDAVARHSGFCDRQQAPGRLDTSAPPSPHHTRATRARHTTHTLSRPTHAVSRPTPHSAHPAHPAQ